MKTPELVALMLAMWILGIWLGLSLAGSFEDDCFVPPGRETIVDVCEETTP